MRKQKIIKNLKIKLLLFFFLLFILLIILFYYSYYKTNNCQTINNIEDYEFMQICVINESQIDYQSIKDSIAKYPFVLKYCDVNSYFGQIHYNKGNKLFEMKAFKFAIDEYNEAIKFGFCVEKAYFKVGACYFFLNNNSMAKKYYLKVLEINSKNEFAIEELNYINRFCK